MCVYMFLCKYVCVREQERDIESKSERKREREIEREKERVLRLRGVERGGNLALHRQDMGLCLIPGPKHHQGERGLKTGVSTEYLGWG